MKKTFRMENLDCANCAAKMERSIAKLDGVTNVSINFMLQKLTLEADDENFEKIFSQIQYVCKKIEPDCTIR